MLLGLEQGFQLLVHRPVWQPEDICGSVLEQSGYVHKIKCMGLPRELIVFKCSYKRILKINYEIAMYVLLY